MAKDYFQFREFAVHQDRCAMKVGTDGTLLGSWAHGGAEILDIGTGTGLIALMMAQRFPHARVTGIDIDTEAISQAHDNVIASPFSDRISVFAADAKTIYHSFATFDTIVCNPPFFVNSLECPDIQRTMARHASTLTYGDLMAVARQLLSDKGELSVIVPFDQKTRLEAEAALAGLFKVRECSVRTTPKKRPRRFLLAYRKHTAELELTEGIIETLPGVRSTWYQELTKDFYL